MELSSAVHRKRRSGDLHRSDVRAQSDDPDGGSFVSGLDHRLEPEGEVRRFEVINGAMGRRRWTADDRTLIMEETLAPGAVVSAVARRHGLTSQQLFTWRRKAQDKRDGPGRSWQLWSRWRLLRHRSLRPHARGRSGAVGNVARRRSNVSVVFRPRY
ncbi:transposase [Xanthobacter sp.]|uniref:transposase n=1 Tax=Xanthobacter sp. TaxID=35809 RepID=UPI00345C0E81